MRITLAAAFLCLSAAVAFIAGCAAQPGPAATAAAPEHHAMKIELLGFPGCPNTPQMRANLAAALKQLGHSAAFTDTNQESLPESDLRRGWPTPTVLVNGKDLFGMAPPTAPRMGCRMYAGGVPTSAEIAERVRNLADVR